MPSAVELLRAEPCGAVLVKQLSQFGQCVPGKSFGCDGEGMMYATAGCRGHFRCGLNEDRLSKRNLVCDGPWEERRNCSCVSCTYATLSDAELGMIGTHCCADNGASLNHGTWDPNDFGNANRVRLRILCAFTNGCTHYAFSDSRPKCADDIRTESAGFGRCTLCGACTLRPGKRPSWFKSYASFALNPAAAAVAPPPPPPPPPPSPPGLGGGVLDVHAPRIPALVISGCDVRYERAAAVARAAGLAPSWVVGVFGQNIAADSTYHPRRCKWPSPVERNLLASHRNAWAHILAANVSMVVVEDDIHIGTGADALRRDVRRCDALGAACELLYVGYVDAFWATHALYVTPRGAKRLLALSSAKCPEPADYHTHRLCSGGAGDP